VDLDMSDVTDREAKFSATPFLSHIRC
jgi:hypothetical protein